jgi:tetratricopeptide (TPR) repeat protein
VWLVDAAKEFDHLSPHGIVGDEFLYEHVHFNFAGNYLLAKLVAEKLLQPLRLSKAVSHNVDWPTESECADRLGLTPYHRVLTLREMLVRLRAPPFDQHVGHESRIKKIELELAHWSSQLTPDAARRAIDRFEQLIDEDPLDWMLRKQFSALLESTGDLDGAIDQWERITNQLPHYAEGFQRLGALRNRAKKWSDAEQSLHVALTLRPDYATAANSLAIALSHLDRCTESYYWFTRAVTLKPDYSEAYFNWGLVLASQDDRSTAVEKFQSALEADSDYLPAHLKLGEHFVSAGDYDAAEPHYRAVVRLKPDDPAGRLNLGSLYLKRNQPDKAILELQRAVELDPNSRLARQALRQARQVSEDRKK